MFSVDFDPTEISYLDLLHIFWSEHDCRRNRGSRQYINAVFYRSEEQLAIIEENLPIPREKIETVIAPAGPFTYAEDYHQNYYLTQRRDIREFLEETYPTGKELADSHVATRLNAFLFAGFKRIENRERFLEEVGGYGLPEHLAIQRG